MRTENRLEFSFLCILDEALRLIQSKVESYDVVVDLGNCGGARWPYLELGESRGLGVWCETKRQAESEKSR